MSVFASPDPAGSVLNLPTGFRAFDLGEFLARPFPPREKLLAPWLPEKGLAMVFAERGIGKTFFALGVAYAVASGGGFLKWQAVRPRKVLLLDGEMTGEQLQERLEAIHRAAPIKAQPGLLRIIPFDTFVDGITPDLGCEEGQAAIEPHIGEAELIVVDNLSTLCRSGKENEGESWLSVQQWALTQRRKGRSVLFVHHAGKGGQQRGTSRREDVLDTVIRLSRPKDYEQSEGARFVVSFTKSRGIHGDDVAAFEAALADGKWTCVDARHVLHSQVQELLADGLSLRDIADELDISKSKAGRIKKELGQ